jgi:redox-sensitive bicupin YhaK (pirin superfamily)
MTSSVTAISSSTTKDLGGFSVRRVLPSRAVRAVGPFVFLDHIGPATLPPGDGINVRPHPHIALSTLTYLWSGEIHHRDSLGSDVVIRPGDVNWMVAGRGIVHSERTTAHAREHGQHLHGLQAWLALPVVDEEMDPAFYHLDKSTLPVVDRDGIALTVVAGHAFGVRAPVPVRSETLYVSAIMPSEATLHVPPEHQERALYVASGAIIVDGARHENGALLVLAPEVTVAVRAESKTHLMLIGGAPLDGERHLFWNFVSSDRARLERAKDDWRAGRFPKVPGDDVEFIPLPD